jgi:NAD(P)-dependent dehydrogenase (short-subunit alcohol dehydrogenase family)
MPVACITGSAKRIGRAIALHLARNGHDIALHYGTSQKEAEILAHEIRALGQRAALIKADLIEPQAPHRIIKEACELLGAVDTLICNASLFERDDISTVTLAQWEAHMAVNLRAPIFLTQAFAQHHQTGQKGCVIHLIDQRVLKPVPDFFSYGISKAGLFAALKPLAQALAPRIRVNAIAPGPTLRNTRQSESDFARQSAATLLGKGPEPEEIAAAVTFLINASSLTGQMLTLDGGQHLLWQTPDVAGITE